MHALIRGGGEGGRRLVARRQHADTSSTRFDDLAAVADGLAGDGLVDGDRIATRGLSAGGLLQGAVFSQRPERWRAVVAEVPFVDVVTTMFDASIPLTITEWEEWGDPRIREQFDWLLAYSPYDNLPPAGARPDLLVTGAVHDPRVMVREPAKWVAALRETDPEWSPRLPVPLRDRRRRPRRPVRPDRAPRLRGRGLRLDPGPAGGHRMSTPMSDTSRLHDEVIEVARDLIRLDTTNAREPGLGNETRCAEYLQDYLNRNGVEAELVARESHRANIVARIPGRWSRRSTDDRSTDGARRVAGVRRAHRRGAVRPARLDAPAVRGCASTTTAGSGAAAPST